ncbi:MAG TPA: hypothetical protein VK919_07245 [Solirubrobacterales bacterium]|nr:hypothetical protein [Solirubrobacterales bacterium]
MELEERSIADLPERCENCGATLTDAEKQAALERETTPVLCSICAAEAASAISDDADEEAGPAY